MELGRGAAVLARKVARQRPRAVAVLGISAYRLAFSRPGAVPGRQVEGIGGCAAWVLPNPSGLNAHYGLAELAACFRALRVELDGPSAGA